MAMRGEPMHYLIDGYNLLYALGIPVGRAGLENARSRLLDLLHAAHGEESPAVTVVFDARRAPPGAPAELDYKGLHVVFAVAQDQADDLIELLIGRTPVPKNLTVVSNDRRLQQAGRRRDCPVLGCMAYLDSLEDRRKTPRPPPAPEPGKPHKPSPTESEYWLREFAELEHDSAMQELFDTPELFPEEPAEGA